MRLKLAITNRRIKLTQKNDGYQSLFLYRALESCSLERIYYRLQKHRVYKTQ